MWRNWNPRAWLMGMVAINCATTMENCVAVPHNVKHRVIT